MICIGIRNTLRHKGQELYFNNQDSMHLLWYLLSQNEHSTIFGFLMSIDSWQIVHSLPLFKEFFDFFN